MRIGIDLGGTKIEGVVLDETSQVLARKRVPTPQNDYHATAAAIAELALALETQVGGRQLSIGIGTPGSISPATGLLRNANSVCLNGMPLQQDLEKLLGRELRMANDANCLAVSEATDGAAAGEPLVFAVILGTGCGGGWALNAQTVIGHNGIAGEWGHNPLPWPRPDWGEVPGDRCWHGGDGCLETWLSGPALAADHRRQGNAALSPEQIVASADPACRETMNRYYDRLARALAMAINFMDPNVIVLGGGLSRVDAIYQEVPQRWGRWIFSDQGHTELRPAMHGDSSGVRGAAWLWPHAG